MKIPRRDKLKIYGDILLVLQQQPKAEKIVLTRVQAQANVAFDRLKNYIADLKDLGLIEDETTLKLTEKGRQYVKDYENVVEFMKRMGLTYE
ncbi:MAG: winged helix-turn-helix domain-containing protein [Candidatus Bathyarchaeota archaeon]|nr:winged helix-turn-helix domain-containing protein [Candidatus Bathyarchaeota archaeon]